MVFEMLNKILKFIETTQNINGVVFHRNLLIIVFSKFPVLFDTSKLNNTECLILINKFKSMKQLKEKI